jgi:hypothetical protein
VLVPRALVSLLLAGPVAAAALDPGSPEWPLVPGRMGFNALPAIPNADPVPPRLGELEMAGTTQLSGFRGHDVSATPYFRLTLPFREIAALEVDGAPIELWRTTRTTQARLMAAKREGSAQGDLRFGARFLVLEEGRRTPAFGLRFVVKSTTGKELQSRRFTNAPGYLIDFLSGKDVGTVAGNRLRVLTRLGLLVWQFAPDRQDDALAYGATLRATRPGGAALALEWRGYVGWRYDDRPSLLGLTASMPAGPVELGTTVNAGLSSDAPPLEVRLGVVRRFEMPRIAQSRAPPPREPPPPGARPILAARCPPEGTGSGDQGSGPCDGEDRPPAADGTVEPRSSEQVGQGSAPRGDEPRSAPAAGRARTSR